MTNCNEKDKCHFDKEPLQELLENMTCEYCGISRNDNPNIKFHLDHIVPRRFGGTDDQENLAISCAPCNFEKRELLGCKTIDGRAGKSTMVKIKDGKTYMPTRGT